MISIYKNKRSTRTNKFRQLLSKTSIQTIGDCLFTESITQKGKEMRVRTKERKEFLENTKKYLERK